MADVICLCDSSDDDDEVPRPPAVAAPNRVSIDADGVIDLLDSDDDDQSPTQQGCTTTFPDHSNVARASSSLRVISQEETSPNSTSAGRIHVRHISNLERSSDNVVSTQETTSRHSNVDDSDSDDDPILQFRSGFMTKKTPVKPNNSYSTPSDRNSVASSSKRASLENSQNPYNKPITSSGNRTHSFQMTNLYAKKQHASAREKAKERANTTSTPRSSYSVTPAAKAVSSLASSSVNSTRIQTTPAAITNPYAKKTPNSVPPSISFRTPTSEASSTSSGSCESPSLVYPLLLPKTKLHSDKRAPMVLALWNYSRSLTFKSHDGPKFDLTVTKLVRLALSKHTLRSIEEYLGKGAGTSSGAFMKKSLMESLDRGGFGRIQTPVDACRDGRYYSIAEACLVALLAWLETKFRAKNLYFRDASDTKLLLALAEKDMWMPLVELIPEIDCRLQDACPSLLGRKNHSDWGAAVLTDKSTRSAEYKQIEKLLVSTKEENMPYLKHHTRKGKVHFEMTTLGFETAHRIRSRQYPAPLGRYRSSKIASVDSRYHNLCLAVDFREGGGAANVLHIMCNKLDMTGIPYIVGNLDIGDYCFFAGNLLCPILIERKSIEDVALSLYDGRWVSQKKRMYHGQYVFGYESCRLVFIIEGKEEKQQVAGGYVGNRKFNVTRKRLDEEVDKLKSEGFEVLRTSSPENSMFRLARWARVVAQEVQNNKLPLKYTYEQFKAAIRQIPEGTDFSRLAKDAMAARLKTSGKVSAASNGPLLKIDGKADSEIDVSVPSMSASPTNSMVESKVSRTKRKLSEVNKDASKRNASQYAGLSVSELHQLCVENGLPKTGRKDQLIERLNGPRPPRVYLKRKQKCQYVPQSYDCGGTALLVALYLTERDSTSVGLGMTKEELYMKAESLDITKNPFSGGTTQTGPFHYDGWSNMSKLLKGDPPLVTMTKQRYKLTRCCDIAGFPIAEALHLWCHEHQNCQCQSL